MAELSDQITDHVTMIPTKHTLDDSQAQDVIAFLSDKLKDSLIYKHEREGWVEDVSACFGWLQTEGGLTGAEIVQLIYDHRIK